MKHLGLSGAGFAIPGIAGSAYQLIKQGYEPDIISGVSSGAILAFLLTYSNKPLEILENNITNFSAKDVFDTPPLKKSGRISVMGIFNLITKGYFSKKDKLEKTLKKYVTEEDFYCKKNNIKTPICLVLCVDLLSGKRIVKNLSDLSYANAVNMVIASASIPIFTKPLKMDKNVLVDGGVRNHILTPYVFKNYDITENWSVYSRPQDFQKPMDEKSLKNSVSILMRTIEIMQFEISKSDEEYSNMFAEKKGIIHNSIFLDRLLKNVYQEDNFLATKLYELGKQKVIQKTNL